MILKELIALISDEQEKEEIMILFNEKIYEKDLNAMYEFFSYFKNNENIIKDLEKLRNKCKDFSDTEDITKMKNVLQELKKEGIYDYKKDNETKNNYINFFNLFFQEEQALAFLDKHTAEEMKSLYDKIDPIGSELNMSDISDIINCIGFFQELKKIKGGMKEIIKYIQNNLDEKDSAIYKRFKRFIDIYRMVIELKANFYFSQYIYIEIDEIINNSKFIFNKNRDEFYIKSREERENKIISIEKIIRLKNKIHLKQNSKYNTKLEKLKFFKNLSINIEDIKQ